MSVCPSVVFEKIFNLSMARTDFVDDLWLNCGGSYKSEQLTRTFEMLVFLILQAGFLEDHNNTIRIVKFHSPLILL